jgi:hypothetical protein
LTVLIICGGGEGGEGEGGAKGEGNAVKLFAFCRNSLLYAGWCSSRETTGSLF